MDSKKLCTAALAVLILMSAAGPALAKGGRGGGGGRMGGPSITRQAPQPSAAPRRAAPSGEKAGTGSTQKSNIDQGIDPKDYGKRGGNVGSAAANPGSPAPQNTQSGFFGGGSFFPSGFSIWPWLWFSGHNTASADDGKEGDKPQSESFSDMMSRWWNEFLTAFKSLLGL